MAIRFEIVINEQEPIVSGFSEEYYAMTASLSAAVISGTGQDIGFGVAGRIPGQKMSTTWLNQTLKVGDKIRIRVIEDAPVTEPIKRRAK